MDFFRKVNVRYARLYALVAKHRPKLEGEERQPKSPVVLYLAQKLHLRRPEARYMPVAEDGTRMER